MSSHASHHGSSATPTPKSGSTSSGGMMGDCEQDMMGGMMGYQQPTAATTVTPVQAQQLAQQWLDKHQAGSTAEAPDQFPGYFTVHILKGGTLTGMLSVNGYSGQIWNHTWHGAFVQMTGAHS